MKNYLIAALAATALAVMAPPALAQFHGPDFNNDGRTDLLWRNSSTGAVFTSFGNGPATGGGRHLTTEANPTWRIVAAADANGDGYSDLLWKNFPDPVMFPNGGGMFLQWVTASGLSAGDGSFIPHSQVVGFGHVVPYNGPYPDAILRDTFDGTLRVAAGTQSGSFGRDPQVLWSEPDQNWKVVATDDFDGNGNTDVLWRHAVSGTCFIVTTGTQYWYVHQAGVYHYEPDLAWQIVDTADLNGDGMADVIWRNTDGRVWVQLMNGFTQIGGGVIWSEPDANWRIKGTGDFNGDGKGDVLWRHQTTGEVFVLLMDGTTVLSATVMHREPSLDWKLILPNTSAASFSGDNSTP